MTTRGRVWPDPAPDPYVEPGEDPGTHLLPNLTRLRFMDWDERFELLELVRDWDGPIVRRWRQTVADLDA